MSTREETDHIASIPRGKRKSERARAGRWGGMGGERDRGGNRKEVELVYKTLQTFPRHILPPAASLHVLKVP